VAKITSAALMRPDHPAITDVWQWVSPPGNRRPRSRPPLRPLDRLEAEAGTENNERLRALGLLFDGKAAAGTPAGSGH
jgi:hypothetical protein